MGKVANTKVKVFALDRNIEFNSAGETELKLNEGQPVVSTGNPKDRTAAVHGSVAGILVHNPA